MASYVRTFALTAQEQRYEPRSGLQQETYDYMSRGHLRHHPFHQVTLAAGWVLGGNTDLLSVPLTQGVLQGTGICSVIQARTQHQHVAT